MTPQTVTMELPSWFFEDLDAIAGTTVPRTNETVFFAFQALCDHPDAPSLLTPGSDGKIRVGNRNTAGQVASVPRESFRKAVPGDSTVFNGVYLPEGCRMRLWSRRTGYVEAIARTGKLWIGSAVYDSLSAAAVAVLKHAANGWTYWEAQCPSSGRWHRMRVLRRRFGRRS